MLNTDLRGERGRSLHQCRNGAEIHAHGVSCASADAQHEVAGDQILRDQRRRRTKSVSRAVAVRTEDKVSKPTSSRLRPSSQDVIAGSQRITATTSSSQMRRKEARPAK